MGHYNDLCDEVLSSVSLYLQAMMKLDATRLPQAQFQGRVRGEIWGTSLPQVELFRPWKGQIPFWMARILLGKTALLSALWLQ